MPILPTNPPFPEQATPLPQTIKLLLAIDTCGPTGSVALGRWDGQAVEILGQFELEGRSYSSTLVAAVGDLLAHGVVTLREVGAIVAVSGPGSFTGVRVGLAAVKGLAESAQIPVVAVSRLEVLAAKVDVASAALDAHRQEIYLRLNTQDEPGEKQAWTGRSTLQPARRPALQVHAFAGRNRRWETERELLAGAHELAKLLPGPLRIAVCDEAAALLLGTAWPDVELVRVAAPTAADALRLCASRAAAGEFVDLALLDGHYLRRSDAEIFGEPATVAKA